MENIEWCRIPQTIGTYVSYDFYQYLKDGFRQQHPSEQKSIFIPREYILETLEKSPSVTGLRFMYGQQEGSEPGSRTIVLMACDNSTIDFHVPNLILVPGGYYTDKGEQLSLEQCWELFNRYVDRMSILMPDQGRHEIPRACFYGINTLKSLLDTPGCAGIEYHFGYNPAVETWSQRYQPVMEAVDIYGQSLDIYVETGQICPTVCSEPCPKSPIPFGWPFIASAEGYDQVPTGALYEMFHYVSPPLYSAIRDNQIYTAQFSGCLELVEEGKLPEARLELRKTLEKMMEKYLF